MHRFAATVLTAICLLAAPAVQAQSLSEILLDLLASGVVSGRGSNGRVLPAGVDPNHEGHFLITEGSPLLFLNAALFNQAIATQLSSFPLGSAAGGFTYSFDADTATFSRSSDSFGTAFTERSVTQGRGKFSFGLNYQHASYDSFEGKDLANGDLKFYLEHNNCCPPGAQRSIPSAEAAPILTPFFEGDVVESALSISLTTDTTLLFLNYGVTDRLDLGVVLPFTRVDLEASNTATILRLATETFPEVHLFDGPNATRQTFFRSGSKSGLGDIAVRGKWNFLRGDNGGLAAAVEVRLPTGDEENLLGSGTSQAKLSLIASRTGTSFSAHANVGYRVAGEGLNRQITLTDVDRQTQQTVSRRIDLDQNPMSAGIDLNPDEFSYAAGFELAASPRLTLSAEVFGRVLLDAGRLVDQPEEFLFRRGSNAAPLTSTEFPELDLESGNLHQAFGAIGIKFGLTSTLLVSATGVFGLTEAGLKDTFAPLIGIDYTF